MATEFPPFPANGSPEERAEWWHRWADAGRQAADLDRDGALYRPEYVGDDRLPDLRC
jgi:hypothetical protein